MMIPSFNRASARVIAFRHAYDEAEIIFRYDIGLVD